MSGTDSNLKIWEETNSCVHSSRSLDDHHGRMGALVKVVVNTASSTVVMISIDAPEEAPVHSLRQWLRFLTQLEVMAVSFVEANLKKVCLKCSTPRGLGWGRSFDRRQSNGEKVVWGREKRARALMKMLWETCAPPSHGAPPCHCSPNECSHFPMLHRGGAHRNRHHPSNKHSIRWIHPSIRE